MEKQAILRVHACEVNAKDFDALPTMYARTARVFTDGQWAGEGPEAVSRVFRDECGDGVDVVERVSRMDDDDVLVHWAGDEGNARPRSLVRCRTEDGLVKEVRIDHDPRLLSRAVEGPERFVRRMHHGP